MKLDFLYKSLGKMFKYQTSWKKFQWEPSCSIWTDGRKDGQTADMTKLIVPFRNFANVSKISKSNSHIGAENSKGRI